jgi:hypothetical protein
VIEGLPELIGRVERGVRQQALAAASEPLQVLPARLHNDAGVIGAAALAMRTFHKPFRHGGHSAGPQPKEITPSLPSPLEGEGKGGGENS